MPYGGTGNFASSFGGKSTARGKRSFTKGSSTIAYGNYSSAEGSDTVTMGSASHGEGYANLTGKNADSAHAEGGENYVSAARGHVEGYKNTVTANNAHAEGAQCLASAEEGHAEGLFTTASGLAAHAEGQQTTASGINAHSEGSGSVASGDTSHAEGYGNTSSSYSSHSEGAGNKVLNSLPESGSGGDTPGPSPVNPTDPNFKIDEHLGYNSHIEGSQNLGYGYTSHTEGANNKNYSHYGHSEGTNNTLGSVNSTTKTITGEGVHVEGSKNTSDGDYSHVEGYLNTNKSSITHIEGYNNSSTVIGTNIAGHIEGIENTVSGSNTTGFHVEGYANKITGGNSYYSHIGGQGNTLTRSPVSFIYGDSNQSSAPGGRVIALGVGLKATDDNTFQFGTYNDPLPGTGVMGTIGYGSSTSRKNSMIFMRDGRVKVTRSPVDDNDIVRKSDCAMLDKDNRYYTGCSQIVITNQRDTDEGYAEWIVQGNVTGHTRYGLYYIQNNNYKLNLPLKNGTVATTDDIKPGWYLYKSGLSAYSSGSETTPLGAALNELYALPNKV